MKVIMIKKYNNYKADEIVEVADGFGTNFLIKNGYALPINKTTKKNLKNKKEAQTIEFENKKSEALELKDKLEKLELIFSLKTTKDVIHGSITTKKVSQELINKGFKLPKHSLPHISITSLGVSKIKIKIFEGVEATLKVNVKGV